WRSLAETVLAQRYLGWNAQGRYGPPGPHQASRGHGNLALADLSLPYPSRLRRYRLPIHRAPTRDDGRLRRARGAGARTRDGGNSRFRREPRLERAPGVPEGEGGSGIA